MAKKLKGLQMIIANRLTDGRVVFLTSAGDWSERSYDAATAEGDGITALAEQGQAALHGNLVVEPQPVEARLTALGPTPSHMKAAMQALGPSVRPDLGYQAVGQEPARKAS